jgi:uncharacterized protein YlxW (UPF0749 family)
MIISEERVRARRAALVAQMAEAQQQYAQLEQTLQQLGRNLDAMQGGLQELDSLLAEQIDDPPVP